MRVDEFYQSRKSDWEALSHLLDLSQKDMSSLTESQVREKFRKLAGVVLTKDGAAAVEEAIDGMERWTSIERLLAAVRGHVR